MKFDVDNGPHIKSDDSTSKIMTRLLIALMPIICFAIFKNSVVVFLNTNASALDILHPVLMILTGVLTSVLLEWLYIKFILKKEIKMSFKELVNSFSSIPGLLLALILPVSTPLWVVAFGTFGANIIGKMIFGGFGQNIFNPALVGYLLISASYTSKLGSYFNMYELDTIGGATPLTNYLSLNYYGTYDSIISSYGSLLNYFTGVIPGAIGEVSKLLIIIAFLYLAFSKTIKWKISIMYVLTVFVMTFLIGSSVGMGIWFPLFQILSGGLLFGAVFMATDPVTSPITSVGQIFYGICLGILTVVLRFLTPYPEGVMTSILFMNALVFLFDKLGIKIKYNIKKVLIPIVIIIILFISSTLLITNKVKNAKENVSDKVKDAEILSKEVNGNETTYSVTSKGWGLIKATVVTENNKIKSIIIVDSSGESQWSEIEKANYVYEVIDNQDNIDELDAVSGSTRSSNGLKNIVKKVLEDINEK